MVRRSLGRSGVTTATQPSAMASSRMLLGKPTTGARAPALLVYGQLVSAVEHFDHRLLGKTLDDSHLGGSRHAGQQVRVGSKPGHALGQHRDVASGNDEG